MSLTSIEQQVQLTFCEEQITGIPGDDTLEPIAEQGFGKHLLWALFTYISGPTQFPEFSMVLMLDDIQVGYYDSDADQLIKVGGGGEKGTEFDLGQVALDVLLQNRMEMRRRLDIVRKQLNLTSPGVYVQQRMVVCEVQADSQPDFITVRNVANGHDADSVQYNTTHFLYGDVRANVFLKHLLARTLQHLLEINKHLVMRRVRPRLRLLSQPGGGRAQITCLATDFYPRHINLTLLRDGEPVDEDQMTVGSVLPNGNGLYQLRKTLVVDEEELQRKHKYTCAASHLSLDNRLDLLLLVLIMKIRKSSGSEGISMETQESPGASTDEGSEPGVEDRDVTVSPKQFYSK
ncbi:MHC class I polypeptide-related sequence B-like [Cololabis saira]|uniref:MHC class I polypeptide-related sequence B-like n=1 Tax=Cololabis saira TaxID=129043 RepID=UPI002AD4C779|nr:MHC class I polypeptide-related sequence B-like [Cololabis saira]